MEAREQPAVWGPEAPAVGEPAAPAETRAIGAGMVAVERTPVAPIRTVAQARVVSPGWLERAKVVKPAKVVRPVKVVERAPAVHRALTAPYRCRFGSIGSMWKVERRR
jgi:hypothetical protein